MFRVNLFLPVWGRRLPSRGQNDCRFAVKASIETCQPGRQRSILLQTPFIRRFEPLVFYVNYWRARGQGTINYEETEDVTGGVLAAAC